jgi:hypothetical protein
MQNNSVANGAFTGILLLVATFDGGRWHSRASSSERLPQKGVARDGKAEEKAGR